MDTDARTDKVWLLDVQRKLYQWSRENSEGQYRELQGWITDSHNVVCLANGCLKQGQANAGHRRGDRQFKIGAADRFRYGLWRAECVTKGACSVRGGATGDRGLRDLTAPVVYSTGGLDILFISAILAKCGEWHAIASFGRSVSPPTYCGFPY